MLIVSKFLTQAACEIETLKAIVWVNPSKPAETAIDWLKQGAEPETERQLGFRL